MKKHLFLFLVFLFSSSYASSYVCHLAMKVNYSYERANSMELGAAGLFLFPKSSETPFSALPGFSVMPYLSTATTLQAMQRRWSINTGAEFSAFFLGGKAAVAYTKELSKSVLYFNPQVGLSLFSIISFYAGPSIPVIGADARKITFASSIGIVIPIVEL